MQLSIQEKSFTVLTPFSNSAISWVTSIKLRWFLTILKLRDRYTFGIKTLKSSLVVLIVKKSKYKSAFSWSKAETEFWPVKGILVIFHLQSSKLDDSWCIGKITQRATTFMFSSRAISTSIIKKISVEIVLNSQKWKCGLPIRDLKSCSPKVTCYPLFSVTFSSTYLAFTQLFQLNSSKWFRLYLIKKNVGTWRNNC